MIAARTSDIHLQLPRLFAGDGLQLLYHLFLPSAVQYYCSCADAAVAATAAPTAPVYLHMHQALYL